MNPVLFLRFGRTIRPLRHMCARWRRFAAGFLVLIAAIQMTPALADVSPEARAALIDLYNNTSGPAWNNKAHWLEPANECSWYGITCDASHTKVVAIELSANHLVGNFIPSLTVAKGFDALETFDLSYNPGLTSAPIPDFSQLPGLKKIVLTGDKLSGAFPDLGNLANLEIVLLDDNQLTGFVPSISALSKLTSFVVASNLLTGPVPEISGLSNLITLDLRKNFFSGPLPKLPLGLKYVFVSNNHLSGQLPTLASVIGLDVFDAENNRFVGAIPVLPQLSQFRVAGNELSGSIPTPPATLSGGFSSLCPNQLQTHGDAFWDAATGHSPWYGATNCNTDPYGKMNVQDDLIKVRPGQATRLLATGRNSVLTNDSLAINPPSLLELLISPPVSPPNHGAVILNNPDGTLIYRNTDGTSDSFLYWVSDGIDAESARVDILVDDNTAPVAADDSLIVAKGQSADTLIGGATSVLANDREPDAGDSLIASLTKLPIAGDVRVHADGTFDYLNTNQNATVDYFEYSACDRSSECSIAKVVVQITAAGGLPADQAPLAVNDAIQVQPNGQASTLIGGANSVLANDTDADGQALAAIKLTDPANGTVTLNQDGTFTYTNTYSSPPVTTDSFTYEACDPYIVCTPGTVTITITNGPQDHLPDAHDDIVEVLPGQGASATVDGATLLANDLDADLPGDALQVTKLTSPQHGDAIVHLDGTFTYTNTDPATTDSFLVEVCDSFKACAKSKVDVFVMHAPTVSKGFTPNNNVLIGATAQMTITLTNPNARDITGVSFADGYPAFLVNASDAPVSNTCGGNADLQASTGWLNLTGATIPASGTCSIVVGAVPTKAASIQNMTGPVASSNAETGASALGVLHSASQAHPQAAAIVTQIFSPSTIAVGGASTLTITLTNPAGNMLAVTDVVFTDQYPPSSYMVNGANATTDCGGTLTAVPGDNKVSLDGGVIQVGKSCSVVVEIAGVSAGSDWSHTGPVTSNNSDTAADVPALLTVTDSGLLAAPILQKQFVPDTVAQGATSTLTLTLTNPDPNNTIHGIKLDDLYPAGIRNGGGLPVMHDDCGFTEDVPADLGWAKLDGGTLAGGQTCSVEITVVGTTTSTNQTGPVTSTNALAGAPESALLTVNGSPPPIGAPIVKPISFAPASVNVGGGSAMTITLHNKDAMNEITGVQLSVIYPSTSMVNGTGNPVESDDCHFTEDVPALDKTVVLSGGKIAAGQDCSIVIDVIGAAPGNWVVQTSPVASDNAAIGPGGSGSLQVVNAFQALQAPVVEQTFIPANILVGGAAKLSITLTNPAANASAITGVQFTDAYSPVHIANKPGASTDCGGTLQAMPGDTSIALSGGVIPKNGACTVEVNVIGTSSGSSVSDVGQVTSTNADPATAPTTAVTVGGGALLNPPGVTKEFNPQTLAAPGQTSSMTIAFTNPNGPSAIDGVQVNDLYPAGMVNDGPGDPVVSDTCGFIEDVPPGGTWAKLSGGTVPAGGCSIVITVVGNATATNDTGAVFSGNAMTAAGSSATLTVNGGGGLMPQAVTFTSTAPNNAIVAGPAYHVTATASSGLPVVLTIDDSSDTVCLIDANTDMVSFIGAGTCTIDANQGGDATFAPAPQAQQPFAVVDGGGGGPNTAPVGVGDEIQVAPNGVTQDLVGDSSAFDSVLDNDIDPDAGDVLKAVKLSDPDPAKGTLLEFHDDGTFSYRALGAAGTDAFTYQVCDNSNACFGPVTVTITIGNGLNNHLPFAVDDAIAVAAGSSTSMLLGNPKPAASVLDDDIDIDAGDTLKATVLKTVSHGDLAFAEDGTFTYTNAADGSLGDDFSYEVCDGHGACDVGFVAITIADAVEDHAPIVVDDAIQWLGAPTTTIIGDPNDPGSVLFNDADPDAGDSLTANKISGLMNQSGTVTFNSQGQITYQNTDPAQSADRMLYEACDTLGVCTGGVVTITIGGGSLGGLPSAGADEIEVGPGGSTQDIVGDPNAIDSVLDNDTDPDGDALVASLIDPPSHGSIVLAPDGTFTYDDDPNDAATSDSFAYEACNGHGVCAKGIVMVTVNGEAPTVTCVLPHQLDVVGDSISLDLSLLFAPPAGQSLSFSGSNLPSSLSIMGVLLSGTFDTSGTFTSTLTATTSPGGVSASENVVFQVLPADDILLRDGFDPPGSGALPCQ